MNLETAPDVIVTPRRAPQWIGRLLSVGPSFAPVPCPADACVVVPAEPGLAAQPLVIAKARVEVIDEHGRRIPVGQKRFGDLRLADLAAATRARP